MLYEEIDHGEGITQKIYSDGSRLWYLNGKLHLEDGPAYEDLTGYKIWYLHGNYHRENGPAIEYADGSTEWCKHGLFHRENGPALEWVDEKKEWYVNGERHREDGPAREGVNGVKNWWLNGIEYPEEVFDFIIKRKRAIMFKFWLKWTDYVMNPNTGRGKRYANIQFDKLLKM